LANRWLYLTSELCELDKSLESLTRQAAKRLRSQFGVGSQTAATLIAVAGDNPERLHSEAALLPYAELIHYPHRLGKRCVTA
jgi:transposase